MSKLLPCLLLLLCLLTTCNSTQDPRNAKVKVIGGAEELVLDSATTDSNYYGPQTITRNIIQARDGDIWLASFDGVYRYDDNGFENVTGGLRSPLLRTSPNGSKPMNASATPRFFSILEASNGDFWLGSIGAGLYRYDDGNFRNFTTKDGLAGNEITAIMEGKDSVIWVGTEAGISRYSTDTFFNITANQGLPPGEVTSISQASDGTYWFGLRGGLVSYEGGDLKIHKLPNGQGFSNVRTHLHDRNGHLWVGGSAGLWRSEGHDWINYNTNFIGHLSQDRAGNIWTTGVDDLPGGGGSALTKYDAATLTDPTAVPVVIPMEKRMNFGILEDDQGTFWIGSLGEVYLYDGIDVTKLRDL